MSTCIIRIEHFLKLQSYYLPNIFLLTASRIRYEITSGNIGGAFAVKNMTGAIYVAGALDYETRKRVSANETEGYMYVIPLTSLT